MLMLQEHETAYFVIPSARIIFSVTKDRGYWSRVLYEDDDFVARLAQHVSKKEREYYEDVTNDYPLSSDEIHKLLREMITYRDLCIVAKQRLEEYMDINPDAARLHENDLKLYSQHLEQIKTFLFSNL